MFLAAAGTIFLLSPITPIPPPPPLPSPPDAIRTQLETQFVGHLTNDQRIDIGVRPDGTPATVVATQRLKLKGTGDYYFVIAAPGTKVEPGPGTQSQPGLRDLGIVWQGFSNRQRVLSARVTLEPVAASAGLPLRIAVRRDGGEWAVRLTNATPKEIQAVSGTASRVKLQELLARLREEYRTKPVVAGLWQVDGEPSGQVSITTVAPLRVRGTLTARGEPPVPVDVVLGGRQPLEHVLRVGGAARPDLELRVDLLAPLDVLPTAAELAAAKNPVLKMQEGMGSVATSWWYRHYLGTPDPLGPSTAVYHYRTVRTAAPAVVRTTGGGGSDTLPIVLGIVLGAAALVGVAVVWARS